MATPSNLITFPGARVSGRVNPDAAPESSATPVIDLQQRRQATSGAACAAPTDLRCSALTPGQVWDALHDDRVVMQYQPQYDLCTGQMTSAEALIRLIDEHGELIYPDRFLDVLEHGDLVVPLGRTVIEHVCSDLADWRAKGYPLHRVAINLSAHQLNVDTTLLSFIDELITCYKLDYSDLEFELTERQSLTSKDDGLATLEELARRGTRIVVDDFGIGYSSIAYLAELPVSAIKLDRSMIDKIPHDKAMQSLVASLISLAQDMSLDVTAEGIETSAQSEFLVRIGCPYAQGFAYAKPMTTSDLQSFMAANTSNGRQNTLVF